MKKLNAILLSVVLLCGCAGSSPLVGRYVSTKSSSVLVFRADSAFASTNDNTGFISRTTGTWQKKKKDLYAITQSSTKVTLLLNVSTIPNDYPDGRKACVHLMAADGAAGYRYDVYLDDKLYLTKAGDDTGFFQLPLNADSFYLLVKARRQGGNEVTTDTIKVNRPLKYGMRIRVTTADAAAYQTEFANALIRKDKSGFKLYADTASQGVKFLKVGSSKYVLEQFKE